MTQQLLTLDQITRHYQTMGISFVLNPATGKYRVNLAASPEIYAKYADTLEDALDLARGFEDLLAFSQAFGM